MHRILIALTIVISLFSTSDHLNTTIVHTGAPENLHGKVKRLIQIRKQELIKDAPPEIPFDTTDFKTNGSPLITKWGYGPKQSGLNTYNYDNKFNQTGRRIEMTVSNLRRTLITVYKFDDNELVKQSEVYYNSLNEDALQYRTTFIYNNKRNVIESSSLNMANQAVSVNKYNYNSKGLLETIVYGRGRTVTYVYKSIDAYGNWIKRIETLKDATGKVINVDTASRVISYYQNP